MPAVLAGIELAEAIEGEDQIAFGDLQPASKLSGVLDLVDIDVHGPGGRTQGRRGVVHVVPAGRVVQPADHVDARRRQDEVAIVQVVLLGGEHRHVAPGCWRGFGVC